MIDFTSSLYKAAHGIIENLRKKDKSWDDIRDLKFLGDFDIDYKLNLLSMMLGENIALDVWHEFVANDESEEKNGLSAEITICPPSIISDTIPDFNYVLDTSHGSAWSSYERKLHSKGFDNDTIHSIQTASHRILNNISLDTRETGPMKGLVIGNVQSGKTANMAALMAMAADQGWNLFIILSGTIENLRIQTQNRLINDLNTATNVSWAPIDNVKLSSSFPHALSKLSLSSESKLRYLMVCLKNSTRLKNLLNWLAKDTKNRENLKILFIDDEADQAGVNASKGKAGDLNKDPAMIERTKINKCLVNLFMNNDGDGKEVDTRFRALDYVAYTATPYANILNEKPSKQSIYPANFVSCLPVANNYIGPQTIFGLEGTDNDGMNIINIIPVDEKDSFKTLDEESNVPQCLANAIFWFYCCLAVQRVKGSTKPVSMLIHISQKQAEHEKIANIIKHWMHYIDVKTFVSECQRVYQEQTSMFSKDDFYVSCPLYTNKNIDDYLPFSSISNELVNIYKGGIKHILINKEGEFEYCKGVHLCIDNCSHNLDENGEHIRLLYPEIPLEYAPGFIVIGGATLSRGLTIEGLVSTYFLRTVKTADTLMQMGRWFGYRIGYELLERLWLTENTKEQFEYLSVLDYELRNEMKNMEESGLSPSKVGIRIRRHPRRSFMDITSNNKKKAAIEVSTDFTGFMTQTTMFYQDENKLKNNYDNTLSFISKLGNNIDMSNHPKSTNCIEWENVPNNLVLDYITNLEYPKSDTSFLNVKLFSDWYEKIAKKNGLNKWNVVISGLEKPNPDGIIDFNGLRITKVIRSKKIDKYKDGLIRIGALRAPRDLYIDIDQNKCNFDNEEKLSISKCDATAYKDIRKKAGLNDTSLLVIYFIDKDSQPRKNQKAREAMNTSSDVVGVSLIIPDNDATREGDYVSTYLGDETSTMEGVDIYEE